MTIDEAGYAEAGAGFGSVGVLEALAGELQHLDERQQERDGALGALVQIRHVLAEAVAASRGRRVVDGGAQAVGAEKPRERLTHAPEVPVVARHEVRAPEREHERRGVDRLLVGVGARPAAQVPARVPDEDEAIVPEAGRLEKIQRLSRDVSALRIPRERVRAPQRERQKRVVVGQGGLEPAPAGGRLLPVSSAEPAREPRQQLGGGPDLRVTGEERRQSQHRQRRSAGTELGRVGQAALEHLPRQHALPLVTREVSGRAQRPQRAARAVLGLRAAVRARERRGRRS